MKSRIRGIIIAMPVCMALTGNILADSIVGSGHDLGGERTNDNFETCFYCHTPHNSSTAAPLWNRQATAGSYTMYDSPTLDMVIAGSPQGVSLACLSCHDGTIALDALLNYPPGMITSTDTLGGSRNLTTDLSDDHPISITYDAGADTAFNEPVSGVLGGVLPLLGAGVDQVECATCHDVHDPANKPFLRMDNASSALCVACHIK